jgi:hypothetical protein
MSQSCEFVLLGQAPSDICARPSPRDSVSGFVRYRQTASRSADSRPISLLAVCAAPRGFAAAAAYCPITLALRSAHAVSGSGRPCGESRRCKSDWKAVRRALPGRTGSRPPDRLPFLAIRTLERILAIQILHQEPDRAELQISIEYLSHRLGFRLIHDEAAINHVVARSSMHTHFIRAEIWEPPTAPQYSWWSSRVEIPDLTGREVLDPGPAGSPTQGAARARY